MLTKNKTLCTLLLAALSFAACKKQDISQPLPPSPAEPQRQLVKVTYDNSPLNVLLFKYDQQGHLAEFSSTWRGQYSYVNNVYSGLFINQNNYCYGEIKNGKLDNAGRLVECDFVLHQPNQPDVLYKDIFTYDANGYLLKRTHTNLNTGLLSQDDYTFVNGNMIKDNNTINGQPNIQIEYTYYDDLPNKISLDYWEEAVNFFTDGNTGKRSRNLRKTEQAFSQNVKTLDLTYSYDMDGQGYPSKVTIKSLPSNFVSTQAFEYDK